MIKALIKGILAASGYRVSRIPGGDAPTEYIQKSMIDAAEKAGIYIGDYVEQKWGEAGRSQSIVDEIFGPNLREDSVVLEIGPGTGMFTRKIVPHIPAGQMHLFEVDSYWHRFLQQMFDRNPRVVFHTANGFSYEDVADASIDLYCSNGVFEYTPSMVTLRNLVEGIRVTKPGGKLIFDFFDSDERAGLVDFVSTNAFPTPGVWILQSLSFLDFFMNEKGCRLETTHSVKYHNHRAKYAVFRKL